jgi:glycerol-1-phosphate dehydrogenase [NAD(P)+]
MERVEGACTPEQLGIDQELVDRGLKEAYHLRDRFTILRFLNEFVK